MSDTNETTMTPFTMVAVGSKRDSVPVMILVEVPDDGEMSHELNFDSGLTAFRDHFDGDHPDGDGITFGFFGRGELHEDFTDTIGEGVMTEMGGFTYDRGIMWIGGATISGDWYDDVEMLAATLAGYIAKATRGLHVFVQIDDYSNWFVPRDAIGHEIDPSVRFEDIFEEDDEDGDGA